MTGPAPSPGRRVVIGVGNPFRRDDGAGPAVAKAVELAGPAADVVVLDGEPTRLLDAWACRELAVVVDAVRTGARPGTVHRLEVGIDALPPWSAAGGSHGAGVAEAVALAAALGRLPDRLVVVGVEPGEVGDGPGLTRPVADAVAVACALVLGELGAEGDRCA